MTVTYTRNMYHRWTEGIGSRSALILTEKDDITKGAKIKKQTAFAVTDHDDCMDGESDHMDYAWLTLTSYTVLGSNGHP